MDICKYKDGENCRIAEQLAHGKICLRTNRACEVCMTSKPAMAVNSVTVSLAKSHLRRTGQIEEAKQLLNETQRHLGFMERAKNYAKAIKTWMDAGKPTRSNEDVDHIFAICEQCEYFTADKQTCTVCGCHVNKSRVALTNKIKMATESCPKEKWK